MVTTSDQILEMIDFFKTGIYINLIIIKKI